MTAANTIVDVCQKVLVILEAPPIGFHIVITADVGSVAGSVAGRLSLAKFTDLWQVNDTYLGATSDPMLVKICLSQ